MPELDREQLWLERELAELREREKRVRERLGRTEALSGRLRAHAQAMHQLFRNRPPSRGGLERTLCDVAKISAQALGIRRTSVWRFTDDQARLSSVLQLVDGAVVDGENIHLETSAIPRYVQALGEQPAVAVDDVFADARTAELKGYLRTHHIGALLDIPIVVPDCLLGVVCHEHVGGPREWHESEIDFASGVAQLITIALEAERRVRAEYLARDREAKYQHLVESLPVTVYSFDVRSGQLDYLSPRVTELSGRDAERWLAEGAEAWVSMIHPDDREPVLRRFALGARGGFPAEVTYRVRLPTGQTRSIRDTCGVVRGYAGEPLAIQGVLTDVTEQVEAELARQEYERRYRTLLENVDLIAIAVDTAGNVTFVNDAFLHTTGYRREQVLGKDLFSKLLPENHRESTRSRYLADVERGALLPRFELTIVTQTGEHRRLLCANTVLRASSGEVTGAATLALDVTDRRRLERELLQHTKLESLGRLAAGVAHDFNNLLTALMGQVALLKMDLEDDPRAGEGLSNMEQVLEQAAELTQSLLLYGRRGAVPTTERLSLDALIEDSMPLLEAVVSKDVRLSVSLQAGAVRLELDRARMRQVLVNLVGNASDATAGYGSEVRVATHVEWLDEDDARSRGARRGGEFVVLSVRDDGRGMDAVTRRRVFDPFFTTKPDGRGTGLGLAIIHSIVVQMGGYVTVDSEVGGGTTFRVWLPTFARTSRPSRAARLDRRIRVLVVDEAEATREALAEPLVEAGYEVVSASDAQSAAETLAHDEVDLMITSSELPDGLGSALAASARRIRPGLRVVLMTDAPPPGDGFDSILPWPVEKDALLRSTREALYGPG